MKIKRNIDPNVNMTPFYETHMNPIVATVGMTGLAALVITLVGYAVRILSGDRTPAFDVGWVIIVVGFTLIAGVSFGKTICQTWNADLTAYLKEQKNKEN